MHAKKLPLEVRLRLPPKGQLANQKPSMHKPCARGTWMEKHRQPTTSRRRLAPQPRDGKEANQVTKLSSDQLLLLLPMYLAS